MDTETSSQTDLNLQTPGDIKFQTNLVCCSLKKKTAGGANVNTLLFLVNKFEYEYFQNSEDKFDRLSLGLVENDEEAEETVSRMVSEFSAFLIPYAIMLVIAGLPLFFLELSFGQFSSLGPVTIWKVAPIFKGVGFGMALISLMVSIYYNVIIMYSVYYMLVSFVSLDGDVPWGSCDNKWNTAKCLKVAPDYSSMNETEKLSTILNFTDRACLGSNYQSLSFDNIKKNYTSCAINSTLPAQEYWDNVMLQINKTDYIGDLGSVLLKNILTLLVTWLIIYLCLRGGVKSSGKVVYFTATFPYLMLIILLVRGLTLEGYYDGILFYIVPKWEKLADIKVWSRAATQIFYSLGPAFGSLITMASYNKFNNNCYRDAIVVALINCGTSVFGGFVVFSMIGHMSYVANIPVDKIQIGGAGLVFIAYPEGLSRMPVAPLWNFLFFFMVFTLGLDSQFAMMECVISSIVDEFPRHLRKRKGLVTASCCIVAFLLGIPCVTQGGMYVLTLMDNYTASYGLLAVCLVELIAINWVYGFKNFCLDIEMMVGFEPGIYWKACWIAITPLAILFIIIMSAVGQVKASYRKYVFEDWAQNVGWGMVILPIFVMAATALYQVIKNKSVKKVISPTSDWGPALNENRHGRYKSIDISEKSIPTEDYDTKF
ncbi:sodium- and chloride-dependent glycine transporter 2-like [Argonauta hians]